jgi:hypothetical protein
MKNFPRTRALQAVSKSTLSEIYLSAAARGAGARQGRCATAAAAAAATAAAAEGAATTAAKGAETATKAAQATVDSTGLARGNDGGRSTAGPAGPERHAPHEAAAPRGGAAAPRGGAAPPDSVLDPILKFRLLRCNRPT